MANNFTSTPDMWIIDTAGAILNSKEGPYPAGVWIKKIVMDPNAANDNALLKTWDETADLVGDLESQTGTISLTNTMTATGKLTSTYADGDIFRIMGGTGTSDNIGRRVIETAGDNDDVIIQEDDWTNEGPLVYKWQSYSTEIWDDIYAGAGDASPIVVDYASYGWRGRKVQNLMIETLTASCKIYIFIG